MTTDKMHELLLIGMRLLFFIGIVALLVMVAIQKQELDKLEDASEKHDNFIEFMQEGKRFTFQDGLVLFELSCHDHVTDDNGNKAKEIYDEYGDTEFRKWLLDNSTKHN